MRGVCSRLEPGSGLVGWLTRLFRVAGCVLRAVVWDSPFRTGPTRTLADLEEITSAWVHWYNTSRLMHRLGRRPPAEAEAGYYQQAKDAA